MCAPVLLKHELRRRGTPGLRGQCTPELGCPGARDQLDLWTLARLQPVFKPLSGGLRDDDPWNEDVVSSRGKPTQRPGAIIHKDDTSCAGILGSLRFLSEGAVSPLKHHPSTAVSGRCQVHEGVVGASG
eukprot:scaffold7039_cov255-Pinguiococcus_pyrenoidosus.AAC.20